MSSVSDDYMIAHIDLEQLAGADQITRHFDVGFRRSRIAGGMIVLCGASIYVECLRGSAEIARPAFNPAD